MSTPPTMSTLKEQGKPDIRVRNRGIAKFGRIAERYAPLLFYTKRLIYKKNYGTKNHYAGQRKERKKGVTMKIAEVVETKYR